MSATDGTINGSISVTVVAGAVSQLRYTTSTASCSGGSVTVGNGGSFTSRVTVYDAFLNPVSQASNRTVTLTRSSVTGTLSPTSRGRKSLQLAQRCADDVPEGSP